MNIGIDDFLHQVAEHLDAGAPSITVEEIAHRRSQATVSPRSAPPRPIRESRSRWRLAAVVAVAAATAVVLVAITLRRHEPNQRPADSAPPNALPTTAPNPSGKNAATSLPSESSTTVLLQRTTVDTPLTPTTAGDPPVSVPAGWTEIVIDLADRYPDRTLIKAGMLPNGLEFASGVTQTNEGTPRLRVSSQDSESRLALSWQPSTLCGDAPATGPGAPIAPAPNAELAILDRQAAIDGGSNPAFGQLFWCIDEQLVQLDYENLALDTTANIAKSVKLSLQTIAMAIPPDLIYTLDPALSTNSTLLYRGGGKELRVLSFSATPTTFDELVHTADSPVFTVDTRRALWQNDNTQLAIDWNDSTIVYLDGLPHDQLLAVANTLIPADEAMAPPVTENCDQYGALCG